MWLLAEARDWHYLFVLLTRKAATGMATNKKAIVIHTHRGILAIQGKGSVSFGAPFDGVTGVGSWLEISSDGGDATLNDMTLDHWPSPVSPVSAWITLIFQ